MNDSYKELLVKKEQGMKDKLLRVVCVIPTIFLAFLTLLTGNMILFILAIAFGVLDYFVFQSAIGLLNQRRHDTKDKKCSGRWVRCFQSSFNQNRSEIYRKHFKKKITND